MNRCSIVKRAGEWDTTAAVDRVVLDADERQRRRIALVGERGTSFLLDLPRATMLRDGDGLLLDDGALVCVSAKPEPLYQVTARDAHHFARLAWHLGNRHTDVEIAGETLRIRRDHVLADMLRGLGARVAEIDAPFTPEAGAYEHGHAHAHEHGNHHHHDDGHGHGE